MLCTRRCRGTACSLRHPEDDGGQRAEARRRSCSRADGLPRRTHGSWVRRDINAHRAWAAHVLTNPGLYKIEIDDLEVIIYHSSGRLDTRQDLDVDIEVIDTEGVRWGAWFFTLAALQRILASMAQVGPGANMWARQMVVVPELSEKVVSDTIRRIRSDHGSLAGAFERFDKD